MPYRTLDDPRTPRRLPMLDRLTIKTPCTASWDAMVGDGTVRHCCHCNRNVYDLRAMDPDEAETFLDEQLATTGSLPCARLYRRPDGRVVTSECPTAVDRRHRKRVAGGLVAVATLAAAALYANRPMLAADDDRIIVERRLRIGARPVEPPAADVMGMLVDDEDDVWMTSAPPIYDDANPVRIDLRADKQPLLRLGSRR